MTVQRALITGIGGQDGSYLAELLLQKGYEVHGFIRRVALETPERDLWRLLPILDRIRLHALSLEDYTLVYREIAAIQPDECYHLAAKSFVSYTFDDEFSTLTTNINGTHFLLAAIKNAAPECRFYFAGSSEMFGQADEEPQTERTRFHPRSIYGITKLAGYELMRNYRNAYGLHASAGLLYNHESPRRGLEFVTRKIASAAAKIKAGHAARLRLGNLEARRDWGFAPEYVAAMWRILQEPVPDDYVIATGETHTVGEFTSLAFKSVGLDYRDHVDIDEKLYRASETVTLTGDASKARDRLGWAPAVKFESLVRLMVESECVRLEKGSSAVGSGS